jgi:hypothetical protein
MENKKYPAGDVNPAMRPFAVRSGASSLPKGKKKSKSKVTPGAEKAGLRQDA